MAHAVVHALMNALAPDCLPVFTSDGLRLYFYALTAHLGNWVETFGRQTRHWQVRAGLLDGQLVKHCQRRRLVRVERRALLGSPDQLTAALHTFDWSGKIQTAFVERLNLTVRQAVSALTRRTCGLAQSPAELLLHLEWWRLILSCQAVVEARPSSGRCRWSGRSAKSKPASALPGRDEPVGQVGSSLAGNRFRQWHQVPGRKS